MKQTIKMESRGFKMTARLLSVMLAVIMTVTLAPQSLLRTFGVNAEAEAATNLNNPVIEKDSSATAGQSVTWDCVYFGSYPQTEIVDQASTSGCYDRPWDNGSYYEVDADLYATLQNATFDENGDTTIGNTKYRRLREYEAQARNPYLTKCYNWPCEYDEENEVDVYDQTYHYFRYEPILWRVLNVSSGKALLLSDIALDGQMYLKCYNFVTWDKSTIRGWLNGYDGSSNEYDTDYSSKNFIDSAFSSGEQNAIITSAVVNDDNLSYPTEGGEDTNDKIFLLSESEVYNTDTANSYGFVTDCNTDDEARRCRSSAFALAMGASTDDETQFLGDSSWWLRSSGYYQCYGAYVSSDGHVNGVGCVDYSVLGCRPALYLDLSSDAYEYAGTVCSTESASDALTLEHEHEWDTGKVTTQPTTTKEGVKTYTCKICGETKTEIISKLEPVNVPKITLKSVKNVKTRKLTIKWKKNQRVNGYIIQMSTKKNFTSGVIKKVIHNNNTTSFKSKQLKKKKTYYVRVCSYLYVNGKIHYSKWSSVKKVKIKK